MKIVLIILCWILAVFSCWFPFAYYHSDIDKKELKISHILVNTEQEAIDIKKQIEEGKAFEEMAEKYSLCPSKEQKGDIGYNARGSLLKEVENEVFKLKLNTISNPIKSSQGWHIIKITGIKYFSDKENFNKKYFVY